MKKTIVFLGLASCATLLLSGCGSLGEQATLKFGKQAGATYYVSVQKARKHTKPDASSAACGDVKLGAKFVAKEIVLQQGHLLKDQADCWVKVDGGYLPGNTVVGAELWEAQLNGLPPRGGVKVKNFTSSKHQDTDATLDLAQLNQKELFLLLGANGSVKSADGKAYPAELSRYISTQSRNAGAAVKLPTSKRGILDFPSAASFSEVGPYQEFDMGAGLAAYMIGQAIKPNHPVTVYVKKMVDRLAAKSTMPYAYGGYHVIVLKDDKTVNACAAPGGFVFITTGMLKYLKSEAELALIIAHEIGHLEFHHSVRELGPTDYTAFALAALTAGINLNDPAVKKQIRAIAVDKAKKIPFFSSMQPATQQQHIEKMTATTLAAAQKSIDSAIAQIQKLLKLIEKNVSKGHNVDFEAAADRRAVSLAAAAGYDANALLSILARIKKDYKGFGEAYPVNRDELVKQFKASYPVKAKAAAIDNFKVIQKKVSALSSKDLFVNKK